MQWEKPASCRIARWIMSWEASPPACRPLCCAHSSWPLGQAKQLEMDCGPGHAPGVRTSKGAGEAVAVSTVGLSFPCPVTKCGSAPSSLPPIACPDLPKRNIFPHLVLKFCSAVFPVYDLVSSSWTSETCLTREVIRKKQNPQTHIFSLFSCLSGT